MHPTDHLRQIRYMLLRTRASTAAGVLVAIFLPACDSTNPPGPPAALSIVGSTSISVSVAAAAADSLTVKVVDAAGRAVSNVQVTWAAEPAGGIVSVSPASTTTNASGIARAAVQAGTVAGSAGVRASISVSGTAVSVPFAVTVNPGAVASLTATAAATMGTGVQRTLITARDQYGNLTFTGVTLASSNTAVAEVSSTGVVTSKTLGAATITAQAGAQSVQTRLWVVPATIQACETNTATLCAPWTLADSVYDASWAQGSRAVIRVSHFSADSVRFDRTDPTGSSAGMAAVYRGTVSNRAVQGGTVTWTQNGSSFSGVWSGTW